MRRLSFVLLLVVLMGGCIKRSRLFAPQTGGSAPVLVELFSNDACVHCPEAEEIIDSLMQADSNLYLINYHVGVPDANDPFYLADSEDINARIVYYYGSTDPGTPYLVFNGVASYTGTSGAPSWGAKIQELHNRDYRKVLNLSGVYNTATRSGTLYVSVDTTFDGAKIRVAMVESGIHYQAPNGDTLYNYLLRDMMGGAEGASGDSAAFVFEINPSMNPDSVDFVVFLQDDNTKEVVDVAKIALDDLASSVAQPVDVYTADSVLSVPQELQVATRIYIRNNQSVDDTFYLSVDRDSLDSVWLVSLCGEYCLPFLHTIDTVAAGEIDGTYQVEFYHSDSTVPSGVVWVKVWSLTDSTMRDSVRLTVEAGK